MNGNFTVETIVNVELENHLLNKEQTKWISPDVDKEEYLRNLDINIYDYLTEHIIPERRSVKFLDTNDINDLENTSFEGVRTYVNLEIVNHLKDASAFFFKVNEKIPDAGIFIGCVETNFAKKKRLYRNGKNIFKFIYWVYCFLFHRVIAKTPYLKGIYSFLTRDRYHWMTKAEVIGRLMSSGFSLIEYKPINGLMYFVFIKTGEPLYNQKPSYGPIFAMNRVGKNGNMIKVYKFRTMHPFSEYLQEYVVKMYGYNELGKPSQDFRLAQWGKVFRKYWLDELPQLYNVLKGDLNIVGVRPLSKTRFNELPEDLRELRVRFKPGCIPPYVALLMPDAKGNIEAERIYLAEKLKRPVYTDVKYFFNAVYNILTNKIRSS